VDFEEYDKRAAETAAYPEAGEFRASVEALWEGCEVGLPVTQGLSYVALGLTEEAGEFAGHLKKALRDDSGLILIDRRDRLLDELGDVLWYVSQAANELGVDLQSIAKRNVEKLRSRKERGKLGGSGDSR
jgi:NTP pyrophosphatase (non-canonical NTP hydrolase)